MRYEIGRTADGNVYCIAWRNPQKAFDPIAEHIEHVVFHSPTGFETGYSGSGPSDLALSILADFLAVEPQIMKARIKGFAGDFTENADRVAKQYQYFKERFIAHSNILPDEKFFIPGEDISSWLNSREAKDA